MAQERAAEAGVKPVRVDSETGSLRRVIIGRADTFVFPGPINCKLERYGPGHPEAPTRDRLRPEFEAFGAVLEGRGIDVIRPDPVPGVPDQLTPRDIGFVLGETFVVARTGPENRREEWKGIRKVLEQIPAGHILRAPDGVVLEGGDVILDRGTLYVGVGERTTMDGAVFLRERFSDRYRVEIVPLARREEGEDILHLDCVFVPVGPAHALVYPAGFRRIPDALRDYRWIEVRREEQIALGTNVLSLSPQQVLSRPSARRVNDALRAIGVEVLELPFRETPKCGGSFRCATLPLWRASER